ncbi:MAG: nitric-oxide reductase large subunit [Candidatus Binatia bacterium]
MKTNRLWLLLAGVILGTFGVLGFFGREVYRQAPPIPLEIVSDSGRVLATRESILDGQQVWQSIGGQQVGSIWGHGAYQAPDWSADWLHREAVALADIHARALHGAPHAELPSDARAAVSERTKREIRRNTYDGATGVVRVSEARAQAIDAVAVHYLALFGDGAELDALRESYALHSNAVPDFSRRRALTHFFFWTAWAAGTERPGSTATYTNNWPHEPLIGNVPTAANVLWSAASVVLLIAGVALLVLVKAWRDRAEEPAPAAPLRDPLEDLRLTPSMRATAKFVFVVVALFCVQVLLGALTAHYTVEGNSFFGIPIGELLPYAVTRTWHVQLAVFWIATAFLTAGLFLAPAVGGREPGGQRLGVNLLFGALVAVVAGSLAGEWLAIRGALPLGLNFWFGHQGYEYVDLGRAWQVALFAGLVLWLVLMLRGFSPALRRRDEMRPLVGLFGGSAAAIGLFYAAGFFYGARTHLSVMEYWRWWVVHLWVEGFMEVFATAAMGFLFARLGLVRPASATRAMVFTTAVFLLGGIPGTFHHLYFSGTPVSVMAVGAAFSALEVVPLALLGFEAFDTARMGERAAWMASYRWPIRFFLGVAFWNVVGAGLFGFLINPPIALYYMQGLNTTPVHGHAALFGVYGLLSLGLMLVVLRRLWPHGVWREEWVRFSFWAMNLGLALMIGLSLLPIGLLQAAASIEHGLWWARSAEFLQQPLIENLRWLRIVGDTLFLVGVGAFAWFAAGVRLGWSFARPETAGVIPPLPERVSA